MPAHAADGPGADRTPVSTCELETLKFCGRVAGTGVGVNIVNMDAIGRSDLTRDGLIEPLMRINRSLLR